MATISFVVYGRPQQRGSKQASARYNAQGQPITKDGRVLTFAKDDNEKSKNWMQMVTSAAAGAYRGDLLGGPILLTCVFWFPRPKSHYRKDGTLRPSAPAMYTQTPDLSKLIRSIEDALTGVVWRDDKQVCGYGPSTGKEWTTEQARCEITVKELTP